MRLRDDQRICSEAGRLFLQAFDISAASVLYPSAPVQEKL
jgi:hypothetical protein